MRSLAGALSSARGLLAYGAVMAVLGCTAIWLLNDGDWPVSGVRQVQLSHTIAAQQEGQPPLLAKNEADTGYWENFDNDQDYYPASAADDPGIYLIAPALTRLPGLEDPRDAVTAFVLALFGLTILIYPLLFQRLFDSVAAAVAAPLILIGLVIWQAGLGDVYWISAWAVLTLVPPLLLALRRWPRHALLLLAAVALAASLATSIRSQAGLPIAIAALGVAALRPDRNRRRVLACAVVIGAYVAISPLTIKAVEAYRDDRAGTEIGDTPVLTHPFWHNVYLGVGFLENPFGIIWSDAVGKRHADFEEPGVGFVTPEYEDALRERYFRLAGDEPGLFLGTTAQKGVAAISIAPVLLLLALLSWWALWRAGPTRNLARHSALVLAPSALIGIAPAILVIPTREYAAGWIGALATAVVLGACAVASAWERKRQAGRSRLEPARVERRALALACIAVILTAGGVFASDRIRSSCLGWQPPEPEGAVGYYTGCESRLFAVPLGEPEG